MLSVKRTLVVSLLIALAILVAPPAVPPAGAAQPALEIKVLSNRADLISGGEALAEVVVPAGVLPTNVRMDLDGRDVTSSFAVRANGRFMGRVAGLGLGANVLSARAKGASAASITITNHPIGGPVFAGFQVQPWICETEANGFGPPQDAQCNVETRYDLLYKSTSPTATGLRTYDPANPPLDVATAVTDQGQVVP